MREALTELFLVAMASDGVRLLVMVGFAGYFLYLFIKEG